MWSIGYMCELAQCFLWQPGKGTIFLQESLSEVLGFITQFIVEVTFLDD